MKVAGGIRFMVLLLGLSGCGDKDGHVNCKTSGCTQGQICVFLDGATEPVCSFQCGTVCGPPACLCGATCVDCKDCAMVCPPTATR